VALVDVLKGSFAAGELSPRMLARTDIDRYKNGAILLENFKVLPQGGLARCEGTRFVAAAKYPDTLCVVKPFEPSTLDAYILEMGQGYLRFYKNGGRLENPPGTPVELVTPYQAGDLRDLRTAQSNDVMILCHANYAPRRLSRLSDTVWDLRELRFNPPPTFEEGDQFPYTLTLGATSGTGVSVTSDTPLWLEADKDRILSSDIGRAILRGVSSSTVASLDIIDPFSDTVLEPASWTLEGGPVAALKPSSVAPVGGHCTLTLQATEATGPELVTNGDFSAGFAPWEDWSQLNVVSGTHTGATNATTLVDNALNFVAAGVQPTQRVTNTTNGCAGTVLTVTPHEVFFADPGLGGGSENDFDPGDTYEVRGTGGVLVANNQCLFSGGTAGVGWISQGIATTAGLTYRVAFQVSDTSVSAQVGTTPTISNVLAEASYAIGDRSFTFTALSGTSYLQFRHNQNNTARVTAVSARLYTVSGFRATNIGEYVRVHQGLVRITAVPNASQAEGEIVKALTTDQVAQAGTWTLEAPAWSNVYGWPGEVILYEGRLCFFGSARFPQDIWMSAIDDLFNMAIGTTPADAIHLSLVDSGGNITLNRLRWAMPAENLLVGTTHGEYRLIGPGDDPLTPASLPRNRIQSTFGSDTVKPLKVGSAILFVQRQGSKVREMSFDERTQTTFVARDITVIADHLLREAKIVELAYQQEPLSLVYAVRSDGQLLGLTYDQSEQMVAWWRRTTQGQFESVATIPDPGANVHQVWVAVARTVGGVAHRFIERLDAQAAMVLPEPVPMHNLLTDTPEVVAGWAGLTVDCALTYSGMPSTTFSGLGHLEGMQVQVVGDGAVFPDELVKDGAITLPQTVATAFVGLGYTPRGRTLPVEIPVRGVTQQGLRKRWAKLWARVEGTACLVVQGERLPFRQQHMPQHQGVAPFSGDRQAPTPLGWDRRGMVSFEVDQPLPCTVIGLFGTLDSEVQQ
jgi:hypothetical protein